MILQSFALDKEALEKRPELRRLILNEINGEQLRRGQPVVLSTMDIAGIAIHYFVDDSKPAKPKETWGLSGHVRVLPEKDGHDPANG